MAKIQRMEELNRSTRVSDASLLSIHVVGADIVNCERERQTDRVDCARFDRQLSHLVGIVAVHPNINHSPFLVNRMTHIWTMSNKKGRLPDPNCLKLNFVFFK
jgi:hypothetical protein